MKARIEDNVIYSPYPDISIPMCSFYTLAKQRLLADPDKIALVSDGVSLTRGQLLAGMERYAVGLQQYGLLPGDRVCIHLNNGVENLLVMYGCILAGATVVLAKTSLTERELRYQAEDSDCTHIITDEQYTEKVKKAVSNMKMKATAALFFPTQLQALVREMQWTGRGMPTVRAVVVGGSVLSASTAEAARKSFTALKLLLNIYGMMESCGLVKGQPMTGDVCTNVDVGVPGTGAQIKVVDVCTRQNLGPHETGEICFRSLSMVKGYYNRPKETAELFDEEGWCKSGDAGYYDESGRLYIVERLKQMIKCMDNQVVPAELEELLLRQYADEIEEVAVVGVPHSDIGEAPAAAIVLTEQGRKQDVLSLAEKIKATISTNLAVHKHLYGGAYFVDSLPKTETAKVNRTALARSLLKD